MDTKSQSKIWVWDWICIQFGKYSHSLKSFWYSQMIELGKYSHSLKSFRYSQMIGFGKYSGNEVWKHLVIWRAGLDQSGVFGFDKSLHHRVNVQCGVKTPKWKWQASTHLSSISTWRFEQFRILQKCEAAKPGEFWEAILPSYDRQQPSVRDRSPRLWNIRFCSVCSHQERSTWATWLTHGGLPPSPMWVSRFRHCAKRPIGGRWTPSILQPVLWNFVMAMCSVQRIVCLTQTKSVEFRCRCQGDNLNAETFLKQKCEIAQPVFEDVLNRELNPESLISTTRINPLDHWTKYLSYRAHMVLRPIFFY